MSFLTIDKTDSYLSEVRDRVEAMYSTRTTSLHFEWANHNIKLVLAGIENTSFFVDAILHRSKMTAIQSPELTIYVVNDTVADSVLPEPFWDIQDFDQYGRLLGLNSCDFAEYSSYNQVFTLLSRQAGLCLVRIRNIVSLPEWERSFPFRNVLYQWFKDSQYLFVHAGAVGNSKGGVLLAGKGGMGKSTATLACLDSRLKYAGDDFVMINAETLDVHSLYNVAKLEASNLHRFPKLAPFISNKESLPQQKGQLFLHFCKPDCLITSFPLKAILLPQFTGQEVTTLRPATKAEALRALAPSTIGLLKAAPSMLTQIGILVNQLPCYWIETGRQLDTIPATISDWLKMNHDA